ncbi:MAG: hypothetical protein AAF447_07375 [Myxococcota bacterium]
MPRWNPASRALACAFLFVCVGCSSSPRKGAVGESCRRSADCQSNLICVDNDCELADFPVAAAGGVCELIECEVTDDCCDEPPPFCAGLEEDCMAGDTFACEQFEASCVCREACIERTCRFTCMDDDDCFAGAPTCVSGTCVQCVTDADCEVEGAMDRVCLEGRCFVGCASDADCGVFQECRPDGECVTVGCANDRECIEFRQNERAQCASDGTCFVPCDTDRDCNGVGSRFPEICEGRECVARGCETDTECRLRLDIGIGDDFQAVCSMPE